MSDTLYFMVGSNGSFNSDQAALAVTITAVPEPATCVVLTGFVVLGFVIIRRRRMALLR